VEVWLDQFTDRRKTWKAGRYDLTTRLSGGCVLGRRFQKFDHFYSTCGSRACQSRLTPRSGSERRFFPLGEVISHQGTGSRVMGALALLGNSGLPRISRLKDTLLFGFPFAILF